VNRDRELQALRERAPLDLLVIGGGIAGAGVAIEAARTGARVALVEARDFASGTSSRSSKLVHGGLRYIAQGRLGLTRESVRERNALLHELPGLVAPMGFLMPVRDGDRHGRRALGAALALYDLFAGHRSRHWHDAPALLERAPALAPRGLQGGWGYVDAQTDDARLVLRVLAEARRLGALTLNHCAVTGLVRGTAGVNGATLRDAAGDGTPFELAARCVVNATGAWADRLRGELGHAPRLRPLRGSHLLVPAWRLPLAQAVAFFHPVDGRPVFALPWEGATIVGTTDLDHREDLDREPGIAREEMAYLLAAVQAQFPSCGLQAADVTSTWAGVRPVVGSGEQVDPSKEAREHLVVEEDGLVTVTGGKLTTFRSTALQALALAAPRVPALQAARGDAPVLAGANDETRAALAHLPPSLRERWLARFGDDATRVLACAQPGELACIAGTGVAWAELRWACRAEGVVHLDDLLLRRTRLGLLLPCGGAGVLSRVEPLARDELGWTALQWHEERSRYEALIARCYAVPAEEGGS